MMDSTAIPYVTWRNGRPRFNPSARERALGFRPHDLKHDDGRWFTAAEAKAYGEDIYREIIAKRPRRGGRVDTRRPAPRTRGFVYFLFCGEEIKIGFSKNPFGRVKELGVAMAREPQGLAAVRGSRAHEAELHRRLKAWRVRGEWFRRCPEVLGEIVKQLSAGLGNCRTTPVNVGRCDF